MIETWVICLQGANTLLHALTDEQSCYWLRVNNLRVMIPLISIYPTHNCQSTTDLHIVPNHAVTETRPWILDVMWGQAQGGSEWTRLFLLFLLQDIVLCFDYKPRSLPDQI